MLLEPKEISLCHQYTAKVLDRYISCLFTFSFGLGEKQIACILKCSFVFQVTYMLEGSFRHEDFCGHKGVINPGDLQVGNITFKGPVTL